MKRLFISMLAVAAMASCSKSETDDAGAGNSRDIKISSAIEVATSSKAALLPASALTGIHFLKVDGTVAPANMAGAVAYTGDRAATSEGAITFVSAPQYAMNDNNAYLVGCYPGAAGGATVTEGTSVGWAIDGATDILVTPIWDAGKYSAAKTTGMAFKHELAQLEVVCQAESGVPAGSVQATWGNITGIELVGTKTNALYTYADNAVTFTGSADKALLQNDYTAAFAPKAIADNGSVAVDAAGMFAPSTGVITLKVTTAAGGEKIIPVTLRSAGADKDFEKGLKHTVTLTFKAGSKDVSTETAIDVWGEGYKGEGTVE